MRKFLLGNKKIIVFFTLLLLSFILIGCDNTVPVSELALSESTLTLVVGEEETVIPTITPANATSQTIVWSSNDDSVATVAAGLIHAVGVGTARIKASIGIINAYVDVTVIADEVEVTFNVYGGSEVPAQVIASGTTVSEPDDPTKEGYTFLGWYEDGLTAAFDFNQPIMEATTIYAKWEKNVYTITFDANGGSEVDDQNVEHLTAVSEPTDPTRVGYTFDSWQLDDVNYHFPTLITESFTLVAKWIPNTDTTYVVNHYVQDLTTMEFVLDSTENLTGTTDSVVSVQLKSFPGMMSEEESYEATILADGSLVVNVRYVEFKYSFQYDLDGGNFTYPDRTAMIADFFADYNAHSSGSYTVENLPMGAWTMTNMHTFFFNPTYRDKWLWIPVYLGVVGSSTNKKACSDIVVSTTVSAYTSISSNWIYAFSYELRGFLRGEKFTNNANWMSSDYSDYALANGFWDTFVNRNEEISFSDLKDPTTLPTTAYKEGYNFGGWYDNPELTGTALTSIAKSGTLYAAWEEKNPVTEIVITNPVTTMSKGATHQLTINVLPEIAFNKNVVYSTSDDHLIKVSDTGLIQAINAGTATITVKSVRNDVSATVTITVAPEDDIQVAYTTDFNGTLKVNDETTLEVTGIGALASDAFTFTSSNPSTLSVSSAGLIKGLALGEATVTIKLASNQQALLTVSIQVIATPSAERVEQLLALLIDGNQSVVDAVNASLYYDDFSAFQQYFDSKYASVNLFLFDTLNLNATQYLIDPIAMPNKTSGLKSSTEFITIHDTANISGGLASHGSYWLQTSHSTSIHFTVGDGGVVQSLDTAYIAHHAGDGTGTTFQWRDTGITATGTDKPVISISTDGYYTFNGVKSSVVATTGDLGKILDDSYFTTLGPNWKIGTNNHYYIGTTYFTTSQVTRGVIASRGGNNNSTGIEMCVNTSGDIIDTWQRTAKLVAGLLIDHQLGLDRVVQHNTFSGKNCPQSLRMSDYWETFMQMVELEYLIKRDFSDATITMTSNNPTVVNNKGRVIAMPTTTTAVTYTITVTIGSASRSITLGSIIPGTQSWSQLDGFFSTK
ncbi:MAG: InlB B-repeat-containing protein [Bacilli bacterium]|jgi:uncharacterized repeat protein (TIGR02543 family)|nr:InlB B-repeat-containing protein [Bacilli bacterium]